jgi:hypothetical protein
LVIYTIKNYDPAKHDEFENHAHFDFSKSGKIRLKSMVKKNEEKDYI